MQSSAFPKVHSELSQEEDEGGCRKHRHPSPVARGARSAPGHSPHAEPLWNEKSPSQALNWVQGKRRGVEGQVSIEHQAAQRSLLENICSKKPGVSGQLSPQLLFPAVLQGFCKYSPGVHTETRVRSFLFLRFDRSAGLTAKSHHLDREL